MSRAVLEDSLKWAREGGLKFPVNARVVQRNPVFIVEVFEKTTKRPKLARMTYSPEGRRSMFEAR